MGQPLPQLLFGPTLDTALDLAYPLDGLVTYTEPRASVAVQYPSGTEDAWYQGTDYCLEGDARWLPPGGGNPGYQLTQPWGVWEQFLAWGRQRQAARVRYVPDRTRPTNYVDGWLAEPFDGPPGTERGGEPKLHLKLRTKDRHYGIAQRGLFYEYSPGGSLTDPLVHTFSRASAAYRLGAYGYLVQEASGAICDKHYLSGLQTTLLQDAVANDVANPADLTNASWTKNFGTVTANGAKAPDGTVTADLFVEDTTSNAHTLVQTGGTAITAGDPIEALVFVRDGGRFNGIFWVNDSIAGTGGNRFGINYNLHTGTITSTLVLGTASIAASKIIPLAGGWYMLWIRGALGGALTTAYPVIRLADASNVATYLGDGASGTYVWGMTMVHGTGRKHVATYTPTSSVADNLTAPWSYAPQAQWDYVKYVDWCPDTDGAQTYSLVQHGDTGFGATRAYMVKSALSFTGLNQQNSVNVSAVATVGALTAGDVVEVLRIIDATGAVTIRVSVNGGAEVVAGPSGPLAFQGAWTSPILSIGNIGSLRAYMGLHKIKSGPYGGAVPVSTMALARAA